MTRNPLLSLDRPRALASKRAVPCTKLCFRSATACCRLGERRLRLSRFFADLAGPQLLCRAPSSMPAYESIPRMEFTICKASQFTNLPTNVPRSNPEPSPGTQWHNKANFPANSERRHRKWTKTLFIVFNLRCGPWIAPGGHQYVKGFGQKKTPETVPMTERMK